jgi:parallel beta helix pectate lyase-like protein
VTAQFCGECTTDAECQSDATYGASTICDTVSKTCVSSTCTTVGSACDNPHDVCCPGGNGNRCISGDCCSDAQCSGSNPVCNTNDNTCAACDGLAAGATFVVVDPVHGRDVAGNGRGTVGGNVEDGACGFKTIAFAVGNLGRGLDGGPTSVTSVHVLPTGAVSAATNDEQFPITVPAGLTIEGVGGPVTVNEAAAGDGLSTGVAFTLAAGGSTLSNLVIDGAMTGVHGIRATTGSTPSTNLINVEVRHFNAAGIRVELSGRLTINSGTNVHDNGLASATEPCGLHVTGQAQAFIVGGTLPIQFNQNAANGILVDGEGSITVSGIPGAGTSGSVVANANLVDGIEIRQTVQAANTIEGLVAAGNGQDGVRLLGGSSVEVRGSVFVGNTGNGVDIEPEGAGANTDLVSDIDLGTAASPGNNVFQSTANPNAAGICLNIDPGKSQTLQAQGNIWEGPDGGVLDCVTATDAGTVGTLTENTGTTSKQCSGGVDIGGSGLSATVSVTSNGISVASCKCTTGPVCQ